MRLGVGSVRPENKTNSVRKVGDPLTGGLRTRALRNDSGSVASLLFHAFRRVGSVRPENKTNSVRKVGEPLTRGLRTRALRNDSGSVASLLFHAFRSRFCTPRKYANSVRKVGDPLTRGLRTRALRNDSGSVASLLFHAFRSRFCTPRKYANSVRKVGDPLTGGLRTRVLRNDSGSVASLLFHAFRNEDKAEGMQLMKQLETGGIQSDEHGGKEFRSTNEAIMEVHVTRLMAQLDNSCLAGTSRTHIDDTRIRRTVGCVGAGITTERRWRIDKCKATMLHK
ncbi:hypothetical protein GCK72_016032 [Caenorhabditis remanei]|uniref:Uncharacterized protein n=1 Tax=Caenorhabditis remanei TaxID=31234 RepID=A0A6A5GYD8_CAERE|nr:hypothetical protein GCK72_016032 [Caenorhabditis remanei]KAF1759565.1 hypothetical protein GCK72_016032 [Caenorhabditis remanei]